MPGFLCCFRRHEEIEPRGSVTLSEVFNQSDVNENKTTVVKFDVAGEERLRVPRPTSSKTSKTSVTSKGSRFSKISGLSGLTRHSRTSRVSRGSRRSMKNLYATYSVIPHVFRYLYVNELLICRRVDKVWNREACKHLREKIEGVVILQHGMSYYTNLMSKSLDIPVGRVFLKLTDCTVPEVDTFFSTVGQSILYLVVNLDGNTLSSFFRQFEHLSHIKELSLNLFHVEKDDYDDATNGSTARKRRSGSVEFQRSPLTTPPTITIEDVSVKEEWNPMSSLESLVFSSEEGWKKNDYQSLQILLTLAPNIKNLNLMKWPFQLRAQMFQGASLQYLKYLSLHTLHDNHLTVLTSCGLKSLVSIQFELGQDVSEYIFNDFIKSVSTTLEYVDVKNESAEIPLIFSTQMKKLETLRLTMWVGLINIDSIVTFAPKLSKLQLILLLPELVVLKEVKKHEALTCLAVNYNSSYFTLKTITEIMKNFVNMFPNVTTFMMRKATDKILDRVFSGWKKLEVLRISSSIGVSDSGITGISRMDMSKQDKQLDCGCYLPQLPSSRNCNITNLQNLKELRIEAEPGTTMPLTNVSVHLGFSHLQQLKCLKLTSQDMGPRWCLRCIADSFSNLKELIIMDRMISDDRYQEQEMRYLLNKRHKMHLTLVPPTVKSTKRAELTVPGADNSTNNEN